MQMIKWVVPIFMLVALSACSTVKDPGSKNAGNMQGAQSSGAGSDTDFDDDDDDNDGNGRHGCTLQVENQTYYFDFDRSEIRADERASVDVQGRYLASHREARVLLEGHTDPRGSREYNVALGMRRALSVARILKEDGASSKQIRVVSYGAEKLASAGHTDEDYQLDRRVNLVYEAK